MVILDTCCVIDLCRQKPSLSKGSLKRIEKGATILSVCFAEIALKIKLGKLIINLSAQDLYQQYQSIPSISIVSIGCQEWFESIDLEWEHKDPVDRLIVAYAKRLGYPIVTTDERIKKYYLKVIW